MKPLTTTMILLLSGLLAFSQPTLTGSYNLEVGNTYRNDSYDGVTGINPGPAGGGQNWDFSSIPNGNFIAGLPAICVDPAGTPFADSASVSGANLCTRNDTGPDGPYVYYSLTNSEQVMLGLGHYESGNTSFSHYVDELTAITFPFSYGDEHNDTYKWLLWNISAGGYFMKDSGSIHVEADAWGSIVTPEGTYNNVLRLTTTTESYMYMNFGAGWTFTGSSTDVNHSWYSDGLKLPVMSISEFDASQEYIVSYLADHNFPVGIPEQETAELKLYPNPATDRLWIQSEEELLSVRVYSMDGRLITEEYIRSTGEGIWEVSLSGNKPGLYVIEAKLKSGRFITDRLVLR